MVQWWFSKKKSSTVHPLATDPPPIQTGQPEDLLDRQVVPMLTALPEPPRRQDPRPPVVRQEPPPSRTPVRRPDTLQMPPPSRQAYGGPDIYGTCPQPLPAYMTHGRSSHYQPSIWQDLYDQNWKGPLPPHLDIESALVGEGPAPRHELMPLPETNGRPLSAPRLIIACAEDVHYARQGRTHPHRILPGPPGRHIGPAVWEQPTVDRNTRYTLARQREAFHQECLDHRGKLLYQRWH